MRDVTLVKLNSLRLKCHIRPLNFFFLFGQGACKSGRAQASTGRAQRPQK